MHKIRSLLLLMLAAALLQGCGAVEKPALLEPPFEAVDVESVMAEDLWPVVVRRGRAVVTDKGQPRDVSDVTVNLGPGIWRMTVGGFWDVQVLRDADGGVSALEEVEIAEERRVEYDPPLPLLPAELRPGETTERTSTAYLYNHASDTLEATGDCTATYRLLGVKPYDSDNPGAANIRAYIVETRRRYRMPLVIVDMHILSAYVPGKGPVAGKTTRVVKLLGMIPVVHEQSVQRQ